MVAVIESPVSDAATVVAAVCELLSRHRERSGAVQLPPWPVLDELALTFDLSVFERDLLLLLFAVETSSEVATLWQQAAERPDVTVQQALSVLASSHWSAFEATRPLRRFQLIEMSTVTSLRSAGLRLDERIHWHLLGVASLDEHLLPLIGLLGATSVVLPSHQAAVARISELLVAVGLPPPVVMLSGSDRASRESVAVAAAAALGMQTLVLRAADLPGNVFDRDRLARMLERELALHPRSLFVESEDEAASTAAFVDRFAGPVVIASDDRIQLGRRIPIAIELEVSTREDRRHIWVAAFGEPREGIEHVIDHFDVRPEAAHAIAAELRSRERVTAKDLWNACRDQLRIPVEGAIRRLDSVATWEDLVLPEAEMNVLRAIGGHVTHRSRVLDEWGFAGKTGRGLGTSALFWGPSGTGKTTAAEVLARELALDLYHVDLSRVVSKYIGDTERSLRRVFDAAERAGAILLFDEADALFGRRGEVNDGLDRYANIEVSYLLQRMESYRGLAILTTNKKEALDTAFMRRLQHVVHFAFPDVRWRCELWRRVLPQTVPTENLDFDQLARLQVAGGSIRNIALSAAFMAAGERGPLRMVHLARAARAELAKLGQPQAEAELTRWL